MFEVKTGTVRDWIREGKMIAVKLGGGDRWRVSEEELRRFANAELEKKR